MFSGNPMISSSVLPCFSKYFTILPYFSKNIMYVSLWCGTFYIPPQGDKHIYFVGKTKMGEKISRKWENPWRFKKTPMFSFVEFLRGLGLGWKIQSPCHPAGLQAWSFLTTWWCCSKGMTWKYRWGLFLAKHWSSRRSKYGKTRNTFLCCLCQKFAAHFKKTIDFQIFMFIPNVLIVPHSLWYYILSKWG